MSIRDQMLSVRDQNNFRNPSRPATGMSLRDQNDVDCWRPDTGAIDEEVEYHDMPPKVQHAKYNIQYTDIPLPTLKIHW